MNETNDASQATVTDLETPCPLVDLDRLTRNLDRMAAYCATHGLSLRPHIKTHKSTYVARAQVQRGAVGLTCATPHELEVMSGVTDDLLLAYPLLGTGKLARAMSLPDRVCLTVALDSATAVDQLAAAARAQARAVDVYVEVDVGMHRVGVPNAGEAVALAQHVARRAPLRFAGVAFYPGHVRQRVVEQRTALERLAQDVGTLLDHFHAAGIEVSRVSGGSTPTAWQMHAVTGVNEVRPGTYVYNDRTTAAIEACDWDDCALTVLATVVSTSVSGQAVVDAGSKALGREPMRGVEDEGFGSLLDRPEVTVQRMSEEHGVLDLRRTTWRPRVGDLVRIVPNHVCIVVHLNDTIYGVRDERVVASWPVSARGRGATPGG
jgi:D-serine deaminase-like pyridoxal phosphate-dependent protein